MFELEAIVDVFGKCGLEFTHETKKIAEFRSRNNERYLYVVKQKLDQSRLHLIVEEQVIADESWIPRGAEVGNRYHLSNMRHFDSRLHTGKKPTHYGITIRVENLAALVDFLRKFNFLPG